MSVAALQHSFRSSRTLLQHAVNSRSSHVGLAVVGILTTTTSTNSSTTTVSCEKKEDSLLDRLLPKNDDGATDWSSAVAQMQSTKFWDELGKTAGGNLQKTIDSGVPTQLSYGFVSGYCSGMALKKIGRVAAGVFGLGFMTLQALSYSGYVQVDHVKIQDKIEGFMDLNEDGTVDGKDRAIATNKIMEVFQFNLPAGGGFGLGFAGGLKSG